MKKAILIIAIISLNIIDLMAQQYPFPCAIPHRKTVAFREIENPYSLFFLVDTLTADTLMVYEVLKKPVKEKILENFQRDAYICNDKLWLEQKIQGDRAVLELKYYENGDLLYISKQDRKDRWVHIVFYENGSIQYLEAFVDNSDAYKNPTKVDLSKPLKQQLLPGDYQHGWAFYYNPDGSLREKVLYEYNEVVERQVFTNEQQNTKDKKLWKIILNKLLGKE
jgi:hypothetical protein